jgi:hypothetical protein
MSNRDISLAESDGLAICELQVPLALWVAPSKGPFPGLRVGIYDPLATVESPTKRRKSCINSLVF